MKINYCDWCGKRLRNLLINEKLTSGWNNEDICNKCWKELCKLRKHIKKTNENR